MAVSAPAGRNRSARPDRAGSHWPRPYQRKFTFLMRV